MAVTVNPTTLSSLNCCFTGVDALQNAERYIFQYEQSTLSCFVKTRSPKSIVLPGMSELISKNRKVFWEEKSCQQIPLSFDGVPFFVLGTQLRECCHGPDRHQAKKRTAAAETSRMGDHEYSALRSKRLLTQNTKKLNCPACIYLRSVICFPMYKIPENGEWAKRKGSKELLAALRNTEEVVSEYRVYVALPSNDTHSNHLSDEAGSMSHSVDKRVVGKIHSLVHDGVRDVGEMRRHIMSFSKTNFPGVTESSNRFFPNNRCLRNHMYAALSLSQFSREDQENLQQHVTAWRNENPDDSFYFVPSPRVEDQEAFIFVYQTAWQRRLLSLYGQEICLLDATYSICKCDVALFFLCVSTNIGYINVGCFLVGDETTSNITRGLQILKQWNPNWSPAFFMTDYDQKEIVAIETTFPDCFTFLCDFHREQSWERWLKSNGIKKCKDKVLQLMRAVAHSVSEDSFQEAVTSLKNSDYWQENKHLQLWFEKHWLSASKRWVSYHRQSLNNVRVTTTNGLERQHYQLKHNYLKEYTEGTITSLISTIINQFVPDSFKRYRENNVKCLETSRMYNDSIPNFLHNRPKPFRDHCLKRLSSAMLIPLSDINILGRHLFEVRSADSSLDYTLDLSRALPTCSCPDWRRSHLPCKHMLCIILKVQGCGWESLSADFTSSQHFNVDTGIIANVTPSTTNGVDTVTSAMPDPRKPEIKPFPMTHRSQTHGSVAFGTRCKMLASSILRMLHLVHNTADYETIYKDLLALHANIRNFVPKEAGLLRRPSRPGRKVNKHGLLRQRRRYRKGQRKNIKSVQTVVKKSSGPRVVPLNSTLEQYLPANTVTDTAFSMKDSVSPIGKPIPSTSRTVSSTSKPVPSTSRSVPSTLRPVPSTSKPVPFTLKPVPSTSVADIEPEVTDSLVDKAASRESQMLTAETATSNSNIS